MAPCYARLQEVGAGPDSPGGGLAQPLLWSPESLFTRPFLYICCWFYNFWNIYLEITLYLFRRTAGMLCG